MNDFDDTGTVLLVRVPGAPNRAKKRTQTYQHVIGPQRGEIVEIAEKKRWL
jgi:hypothetical protein